MAIDLTVLDAQYAAMLADVPVSATHGGNVYTNANRTVVTRDRLPLDAGELQNYSFSLWFQVSVLQADIVPNDLVIVAAVNYIVINTELDSIGGALRVDLVVEEG